MPKIDEKIEEEPLIDSPTEAGECSAFRKEFQKCEESNRKTWAEYLKLVTVEPTMFFYMLAFMLTSVVEQSFFLYKACTVDLSFPENICLNLTYYNETNKKVQVVVSTFHQNNDIASHVIPIFLALFVGAWTDRRGRKLLLLLGLIGKLWYSVWIIINSLQDTWPLSNIIWTASLPSGLTGADLSIFAAAFSYICDITTQENRTLRITVLDVTYLASMPLGVVLGKYLFAHFGRSYTKMFAVNAALLMVSLVYSFFRLDWITNPHQKPLKLCCWTFSNKTASSGQNAVSDEDQEKQPCCLLDFFDKSHLTESVKTITKVRPNHGRIYLIILILSMGFYTFQRDERQMSYLYTNLKFKWDVNLFSDFRIFQSSTYVLGTFLCIPLLVKFFKLSDTSMVLIGTTGHAIARVIFALAEVPWLFYLGASIASLGPVVAPVLRSMTSKIVPTNERGKVFAILSVADTTVPLFSGVIYTQVYNHTIHTYPSAIFWVTVATQMFVFIVAVIIRITKPKEDSTEEKCT